MIAFNLIVSTYRFREEEAHDEILDLLEKFGDPDAECEITEIRGILIAQTKIHPGEVVKKLRESTLSDPWELRYVLRVIPSLRTVATTIEDITNAVEEMAEAIGPQESFRITVEKRHCPLATREIVDAVAEKIQRKVNLENPDKVVLIQILGSLTGVSIIRPDEIFSSTIEKRR